MESLEIVRTCYEWEVNNLNVEGWAKKSKEKLEIIGLAYILKIQAESNANKICKIIRERCNDIERQNIFSNISKLNSLEFYCKMKHEWDKESYIDECTRREWEYG
jgi:predicted transcriptional regulator